MKSYIYLLIDLGCLLVPFLASFYSKRPFYKDWKSFFIANISVSIPFLVWDIVFTENKIWGFNAEYLTGITVINLPLEEVLFFVCIPYASVFTYFSLRYLVQNNFLEKLSNYIWFLFALVSLFFVIFGYDLSYTFWTGILTFMYLLVVKYLKIEMSYVYLTYLLIIPFFIMSNGLLTGSLLDAPIVWYNNEENLGIRIFTIPVEDSLYAFLLIAPTVNLFERFSRKKV